MSDLLQNLTYFHKGDKFSLMLMVLSGGEMGEPESSKPWNLLNSPYVFFQTIFSLQVYKVVLTK